MKIMKNKNSDCLFVSPNMSHELEQSFEKVTLENDFVAVYEDHIPTLCILLISGKVNLYKKKRKVKTYTQNTLIGLQHLINLYPVKYTWKICANSKVIFIDQSSVKRLQVLLEQSLPSFNATP